MIQIWKTPFQKNYALYAAALVLTAACGFSCGNERNGVANLRTADVPVAALIHSSADPTTTFPELFPIQVAIYWTNSTEGVLGVVHAFREMGIPFFVTRDFKQAMRHRLLVVYPSCDSSTFTSFQIGEMKSHLLAGGSIFAVNVLSQSLGELFGFTSVSASRERHEVTFSAGSDPALRYLNRAEELQVPLGAAKYTHIFWTNGYKMARPATVLAHFEDGSTAVARKSWGKGAAYLCGISFHDVILRNQVNRDYDAERHYVNAFEPGSDVWLLMLRAWYESAEPAGVRVSTMPSGLASVVLVSHDVDWENSFAPALVFAKSEASLHATSIFFIQTKYVSDANSHAFFFGNNLSDARTLVSTGNSMGSHSVIHSRGFNKFTIGTGAENYPVYQPRGTGFDTATGASVLGELRVSKQLLDGQISDLHVDFFRAGHLRVPESLPEALQRTGYRYDSSFTADDVLSNFPYVLPLGLLFEEDSGIYEFPVTIDDSDDPPLAERSEQSLDVIRANAENGAPSIILIHTTEAAGRLKAEEALLRGLPPEVSTMNMEAFARFWRARDRLEWTIRAENDPKISDLEVSSDEEIAGLTFEFQDEISSLKGDPDAVLLPDHRRILLPVLKAHGHIRIQMLFANTSQLVGKGEGLAPLSPR